MIRDNLKGTQPRRQRVTSAQKAHYRRTNAFLELYPFLNGYIRTAIAKQDRQYVLTIQLSPEGKELFDHYRLRVPLYLDYQGRTVEAAWRQFLRQAQADARSFETALNLLLHGTRADLHLPVPSPATFAALAF